ncbi:MAG TPA: 4-hydroxybenzoate octaprenyltransferase [Pseudomonadales bacterium]
MSENSRISWPDRIPDFIQLMRLDKPIGIFLLLWPTLWALWIAGEGKPSIKISLIFLAGVVLMRSAGCVINDFADRKIDGHVERTKNRPIATGRILPLEALLLCAVLLLMAFILVLFTNLFTILLSVGAALLAGSYPFMKRYTYFPQVVLGAAFAWAIPMSFAAHLNTLPSHVWLIYTATLLWTMAYDTLYAMVDRDDDIRIGVKSTAILFGDADKLIIGILQISALLCLVLLGVQLKFGWFYYSGLILAAALFGYQQFIVRERDKAQCFKAFLNNNWVGMVIFFGIALQYAFT